MATIILIKAQDITKNTLVGGNADQSVYSDIKNAQITQIKPLLGDDLYEKICGDYASQSLTGDYEIMYEDYIKPLVIHSATEMFLSHHAYKVSDIGIVKFSTETSVTVSKEEVDFLVQNERKLYENYKREFLRWINTKDIPEWEIVCEGDESGSLGGWWI